MRSAGLAVALVLLTGAGCSAGKSDPPTEPLPPDQVVFIHAGVSAMAPSLAYAFESPGLMIWGDGTVVQVAQDRNYDAPAAYRQAQVDPLAVAAFVAETEQTGLIDEGTDFGSPDIMDASSTTLLLHGQQGETSTSIYAYGFDDVDVSWWANRNRKGVRTILEQANGLIGDAETTEFEPERVLVFEQDGGRSHRDYAVRDWPGPDPETFLEPIRTRRGEACGEVTGPEAASLYRAAKDHPGGLWNVKDTERTLLVNPLPWKGLTCTR